ncbi:MAG: class I SAM-dependent methyltransferase [Anaerolineae bacterium]
MSKEANRAPEAMADFFEARSGGYDEHMRRAVASFDAFYEAVAQPFTPTDDEVEILDLGCGTGLELGPIVERAPNALITAVDLSAGMLARLRAKYAGRIGRLALVHESYLSWPMAEAGYDYVVAVMTLHHLLPDRKRALYARIRRALRPGGIYVEGDWVVPPEKEAYYLQAYHERLAQVEEPEEGAYHLDIPFSLETQRRLLVEAGFAGVRVIWNKDEAAVYVARQARPGLAGSEEGEKDAGG